MKAWNKDKKLSKEHKKALREAKLKNPVRYWLNRKRPLKTRKKISLSLKKLERSDELMKKILENLCRKGEKNHKWMGDNVGYLGLHSWVKRQKGKASNYKCEHCGRQAGDWSNIDHNYYRDINDFVALCHSCHKKYDLANL